MSTTRRPTMAVGTPMPALDHLGIPSHHQHRLQQVHRLKTGEGCWLALPQLPAQPA